MTDKKIPVSFAIYEPYEDCPMWEKRIGDIPFDQAADFLRTIANASRNSDDCAGYIWGTYSNTVVAYRGENTFKHNNQNKNYSIDNGEISIGNHISDEDSAPMCIKHKNRQRTQIAKLHACANAIRNGKCTDPLMRKLAAMMYPEKYNDKQR